MNPFEAYMRAMRPFITPSILMIESYAHFLKEVGQGKYSQPQASVLPEPQDAFPETKLDSKEPRPAPAAFDPFASWRNLSAFMPAFHAPGQAASQDERDHSEVASENDAIRPAEALLHELAAEAEHIRLELADIEAKDRARGENQPPQARVDPFETYRACTEIFMNAFEPAPARRPEDDIVQSHALRAPEPKREISGITHEAAQQRAKKAWRTRRDNAAKEEERKAARRKARSRTSSKRQTTRRAGS